MESGTTPDGTRTQDLGPHRLRALLPITLSRAAVLTKERTAIRRVADGCSAILVAKQLGSCFLRVMPQLLK
jgi:hypothetical protein